MDDVTKRFFEVLDKIGTSGASLCNEIPGLTKQKLSNARNGRNSIQIDVVSHVCSQNKNINPGYILTGNGNMFFEDETSKDNNPLNNTSNDIGKDLRTAVRQLEDANDTINVLKEVIKKQLVEIEEFKRNSGNKKMVK